MNTSWALCTLSVTLWDLVFLNLIMPLMVYNNKNVVTVLWCLCRPDWTGSLWVHEEGSCLSDNPKRCTQVRCKEILWISVCFSCFHSSRTAWHGFSKWASIQKAKQSSYLYPGNRGTFYFLFWIFTCHFSTSFLIMIWFSTMIIRIQVTKPFYMLWLTHRFAVIFLTLIILIIEWLAEMLETLAL